MDRPFDIRKELGFFVEVEEWPKKKEKVAKQR